MVEEGEGEKLAETVRGPPFIIGLPYDHLHPSPIKAKQQPAKYFVVCYPGDRHAHISRYSIAVYCLHKAATHMLYCTDHEMCN